MDVNQVLLLLDELPDDDGFETPVVSDDDDDDDADIDTDLNLFSRQVGLDIPETNSEDDLHDSEVNLNEDQPNYDPTDTSNDATTSTQAVVNNDIENNIEETSQLNRKWTKRERITEKTGVFERHEAGPVTAEFAGCNSATDIFLVFFNEEIQSNIIQQTNTYALQRGRRVSPVCDGELLGFLGINILMGYHSLPSYVDYFSCDTDLGIPIVRETMSRDRFASILSNLHLNDNAAIPHDNKDKLIKLRPFLDSLNDVYLNLWHPDQSQSIDESMIKFKGRSSLKQYNPMKPIKRGYKVWVRTEMSGYISQFEVYQGRNDNANSAELALRFGLGGRVVVELCEPLFELNHDVYFDNFFTSLPLLEHLKAKGVNACGTVRMNRSGLPKNLASDKQLKRGDSDSRVSDTGITVTKWKDNKSVHAASNFHGTEIAMVQRTQKDGSKKEFPCPLLIKEYNIHMGGVDKADMLKALYGLNRKSVKWWHRIFYHFVDVTLVNAYLVYCTLVKKLPLLTFRRNLAMGLLTLAKQKRKISRGRPSFSPPSGENAPKRRKFGYSVPNDVRKSGLGVHWVTFNQTRGRCELCSMAKVESRPFSTCSACKVYLCCNREKNCFKLYHE